jgi:hypothetical protein
MNTNLDYTVEELVAMSDEDFAEVVTDDLALTGKFSGPFQQPETIHRTMSVLIEHVWYIDSVVRKRAEDPNCTPERYEATLRFRRHLLSVVDAIEKRITWMAGKQRREASEWKQLLHEVLDEIVGGPNDHLLDEFEIPFAVEGMTLRTWRDIRNVKDPSRIPAVKGAAA